MTVEDNIRSVLEMTDTTPEYQKDKLESLIAEFGLNKVRKNLGDQLSGENAAVPRLPAVWLSIRSLSCLMNRLPV